MNGYTKIKTARTIICDICDELNPDEPCEPSWCERMQRLEEDAIDVTPKWTKVEDGLPEEDERVLAYFPDMAGSDCEIQISKGWALNKFVSHWMPLPDSPKGQKVGCSK